MQRGFLSKCALLVILLAWVSSTPAIGSDRVTVSWKWKPSESPGILKYDAYSCQGKCSREDGNWLPEHDAHGTRVEFPANSHCRSTLCEGHYSANWPSGQTWSFLLIGVAVDGRESPRSNVKTVTYKRPDTTTTTTTLAQDLKAPLIEQIVVSPAPIETSTFLVPTYERKQWKHWIDADKDCQNTRQETLIAQSLTPVVFKDERKCKVASGTWICPYTSKEFTDPGDLDIDHVVSLEEAHFDGGWQWGRHRMRNFANDPGNVWAVEASANRSKKSKPPQDWLPSANVCNYLQKRLEIKEKWRLSFTPEEVKAFLKSPCFCDRHHDTFVFTQAVREEKEGGSR